jgi:predicted nucleotide-binding protein
VPQKQRNGGPADPEGEPELLVPAAQVNQELEAQIAWGQELLDQTTTLSNPPTGHGASPRGANYAVVRDEFDSWNEYNEQLLRSRFSTGKLGDSYRLSFSLGILFPDIEAGTEQQALNWLARDIDAQLGKLRSIRRQLNLYKSVAFSDTQDGSVSPRISDKIFIVHGHDGDIKLQVAEFIERVTGERPVILHEQADSGRTIIEKFEEHAADAGFAIILLTADDLGKAKDATQLNPRARQNVVLEFGYFMGKLGRGRVAALHEAGVELPSDVTGVLYKSLAGNWHTELARELKAAY